MGDPEAAVLRLLKVLPHHRREKTGGLAQTVGKRPTVEEDEHGVRVARQRVDQCLTRCLVVPVACRLAGRRVVVVPLENRAHLPSDPFVSNPKDAADRGTDHRHGVLRRHGIVERRRVQHPLATHHAGFLRHVEHGVEDPVRVLRPTQPRPHVHQHRVDERRVLDVQTTRRVLPAHVEREPIHRLPVGETLDPLQHHHHRDDARRHRPSPDLLVEVREHVVREKPVALGVEQAVDGRRRQLALAVLHRGLPDVGLLRRTTKRHAWTWSERHPLRPEKSSPNKQRAAGSCRCPACARSDPPPPPPPPPPPYPYPLPTPLQQASSCRSATSVSMSTSSPSTSSISPTKLSSASRAGEATSPFSWHVPPSPSSTTSRKVAASSQRVTRPATIRSRSAPRPSAQRCSTCASGGRLSTNRRTARVSTC